MITQRTAVRLLIATLILVALILASSGCANISGTRTVTGPDGRPQTLTIKSTRFLWVSEGVQASLTDDQGFTFTLAVARSRPDQESIAILSAAVVDLAKTMAKEGPTNSVPKP